MVPCEIRENMEAQIVNAYKELEENRYDSPQSGHEAQSKISRLLMQKHAHERKHGCRRESE